MHILHLYKDYPPVLGGIEHHLRTLAEGQVERGHRVTVLVTATDHRTRRATENGVDVIRAGRLATLASTPLSLAMARELARLSPDIAHLQFPYPPGELYQALLGRSRATVVSYQSDIVRQRFLGRLYRPLMRRLLRRADAVLVSSEAYLGSSPILGELRDRCHVVPLGIDPRPFAQVDAERVAALRRRWPGPLVLFVGRLRYYKGVDILIDAVAELDATLLIIGRGAMERTWRQQAAASPAAARIHFLGDVEEDELPIYLAAAELFVLPSTRRSEAFGLAQVEAMAAGKPVVSTALATGTSTVNRDGETGLVVPPNDAAALAAAIACLLDDRALRDRLGAAARQRVESDLHRDQMLDRVAEIYDRVLARSVPRIAEVLTP